MLTKVVDIDPHQFGGPLGQGYRALLLETGHALRFLHPGGNDPEANCWMIAYPSTGQRVVIMTNGAGGEALMKER